MEIPEPPDEDFCCVALLFAIVRFHESRCGGGGKQFDRIAPCAFDSYWLD
jgi:hypothetical protein